MATTRDMEGATTVCLVHQLLQLFIQGYSSLAAPLTALTSIKVHFQWTEVGHKALLLLRECFTLAPTLQIPVISKQFVVEVDISGTGTGAVLIPMFLHRWQITPLF